MIYFGLSICIGSKDAIIQESVLGSQLIEVHTVDHTDALDNTMCIATPWRANQLYFAAVHLGKHRIIKKQVAFGTTNKGMPDGFPHVTGTHSSMSQKVADVIRVE